MEKIKRINLLFLVILTLCFIPTINTKAAILVASDNERLIDDDTFTLTNSFYVENNEILFITFELNAFENEYLQAADAIKMRLTGYYDDGSYGMGNVVYEDECIWDTYVGKDYMYGWYYTDYPVKEGKYYLNFSTHSDKSCKISYEVYRYSGFTTAINFPSNLNMEVEDVEKLQISNKIPYNSFLGADNVSSSNEKVVEVHYNQNDDTWYVYALKAGQTTLTIKLKNGNVYRSKVTVTNPAPKLNYTSYRMCTTDKVKVQLLYSTGKITYKSSNKKIATVSKSGVVTAKKIGKCTITVKNNGKTYKMKVNVVRQDPDFGARLTAYNTRNNYFTVKFKNNSNKALTILRGTTKVMDADYKSFDRNINLSKSYTIKPGKSKTIKFKVKGKPTWYKYIDFTLQYKFKFDGKTYTGRTWSDDSVYKKGSSWYYTYWDEDWYIEWWQ